MMSFRQAMISAIALWSGVAGFQLSIAGAAERLTLTFPGRTVAATFESDGVRRVPVSFKKDAVELDGAQAAAFRKAVLALEPMLGGGRPVMIALEHTASSPADGDLAYQRARNLRARLLADLPLLSGERLVVATIAVRSSLLPDSQSVMFLPVQFDFPEQKSGTDAIRAVALDSAFVGPVYATYGDPQAETALAQQPGQAETSQSPASAEQAAEALPEAAPLPPTKPQVPAAAEPLSPALAYQAPPAPAQPSQAAQGRHVAPGYVETWCPAPSRILDDFYPGGPIVPCAAADLR